MNITVIIKVTVSAIKLTKPLDNKSLSEFIYICEYLSVTPKDFFDKDISEPLLLRQLINLSQNMSDKDLLALINIADRLNEKQKIIDKQKIL